FSVPHHQKTHPSRRYSSACASAPPSTSGSAVPSLIRSGPLISEEPLLLVVLLRARVERDVVPAGQGVVLTDQVTLRQSDLAALLEGRLRDLVGDVRADLIGRGDQRGRDREGGDVVVEVVVGVGL